MQSTSTNNNTINNPGIPSHQDNTPKQTVKTTTNSSSSSTNNNTINHPGIPSHGNNTPPDFHKYFRHTVELLAGKNKLKPSGLALPYKNNPKEKKIPGLVGMVHYSPGLYGEFVSAQLSGTFEYNENHPGRISYFHQKSQTSHRLIPVYFARLPDTFSFHGSLFIAFNSDINFINGKIPCLSELENCISKFEARIREYEKLSRDNNVSIFDQDSINIPHILNTCTPDKTVTLPSLYESLLFLRLIQFSLDLPNPIPIPEQAKILCDLLPKVESATFSGSFSEKTDTFSKNYDARKPEIMKSLGKVANPTCSNSQAPAQPQTQAPMQQKEKPTPYVSMPSNKVSKLNQEPSHVTSSTPPTSGAYVLVPTFIPSPILPSSSAAPTKTTVSPTSSSTPQDQTTSNPLAPQPFIPWNGEHFSLGSNNEVKTNTAQNQISSTSPSTTQTPNASNPNILWNGGHIPDNTIPSSNNNNNTHNNTSSSSSSSGR